jgi:hypothetical protein
MKKILGFLAGFAVLAFIGMAVAQNVSNYMEQGGARWVVGGELDIVSGGTFALDGTTVSATAAELDECHVTTHFTDVGAASSAYAASPCTGTLTKVYTVIWGTLANGTADMSVYANGILVSPASFLISTGSVAGTVDSYTRTAGGVLTAGQAITITSDGGGDGTVAATVTFVIDR